MNKHDLFYGSIVTALWAGIYSQSETFQHVMIQIAVWLFETLLITN